IAGELGAHAAHRRASDAPGRRRRSGHRVGLRCARPRAPRPRGPRRVHPSHRVLVVGFAYAAHIKRLAFFVAVVACSPPPKEMHPPPTPATSSSQTQTTEATPMSDEARARKFIDQLVKHDFANATATFDEKMLAGLPKDKLEKVWMQVESQAG